jgi:hypothetical protein
MLVIDRILYNPVTKKFFANIRGNFIEISSPAVPESVVSVDELPESGDAGKIYYNTTDNTYNIWDAEKSAFTHLGVDETVVITDIDDVEQAKEELIPGTQSVIANGYVLEPNVFYNIENWQKDLTFDGIAFKFDATDNNVYAGRFTAWADAMSIGLPAGVSLPDETVDIIEGHTYEFNIWQGVCIIQDVTITSVVDNG